MTLFAKCQSHYAAHRIWRRDCDIKKNRACDTLVKKLTGGKENVTVFWGSGSTFFSKNASMANVKDLTPASVGFKRAVERHRLVKQVILLDEYGSSKYDPYSGLRYAFCFHTLLADVYFMQK